MSTAARLGVAAAALTVSGAVVAIAPPDEAPDGPFVRTGGVGDTVSTEYADVTVTGIHAADRMDDGSDSAVAAGTFLVADVELLARREATYFEGFYLRDREDRLYTVDGHGDCDQSGALPAGVRWYARICFDVPASALAGATLILAREDGGKDDGASWRRDEVVEIDLGIDGDEAEELWDATDAYAPVTGSYTPFDPEADRPVEEPTEPTPLGSADDE